MSKTKRFIIEGRFPSLNDYIATTRKHRLAGAKMKAEETERVRLHLLSWGKIYSPVYIQFTWLEQNSRRDPDNIVFAKKFILDGMVKAGVLINDNQEWVVGFEDIVDIDKENPRVEVEVAEVK